MGNDRIATRAVLERQKRQIEEAVRRGTMPPDEAVPLLVRLRERLIELRSGLSYESEARQESRLK